MNTHMLVQTPKAGPVTISYNGNSGYEFTWGWIDLKDEEKDNAVLWLHDEGFIGKVSGALHHDTLLERCIVEDLINSIKELEYK